MPHASESFVDMPHDLRRRIAPAELEELLPNVACIAVHDRFRDPTEQLMNHDSLVFLRNTVECLLDNMATKRIHAELERVATDGIGNRNHLIVSSMLKTSLNQEVAEAIDHEWKCLSNDGFDNFVFLIRC